ncbi:MAG: tetratricopeptide repeat protein [Phenylobacterium sp.]|uniref:tetratricopeptide repeat protein n=1 Tax=Phenylobacterium sp. TaxID=1871053 RepID=UPI0012160424|nr:tetratricopeptide repeat protein [Phenylobacterium sp.]TAJ70916.1 MAG: tetratricopeptide repeat protein [Phenylobacterium sp.]
MAVKDQYGHDLSGASATAAELYQKALDAYHCYAGEPFPLLQQAVADSPGFVMAHVLMAYMTLVGTDTDTARIGVGAFDVAKDLPATARETGHLAAIGSLLAGEIRAAGRILEDVSIAHPRDVLALQAGQLMDFLLGDSRMLRDRIGRALPAWSADMPNYHAILGMHAFGLEETALYDRAEAAGRLAIHLEPRNNWAQHAVAHVLEMQDRRADGVTWMRQDSGTWSHQSFFAIHNWWHLALFHLGLGEIDEVLALYDGPIYGDRSGMAFDMVDAAALLWRLKLRGVDVGDRWAVLAGNYATQPRGGYAFDDVHAVMAFVGAGRDAEAEAALAAMAAAVEGPGDNAMFTRDVGLPVAQALTAFGRGEYARTCELLRGVRNRAGRFGGSHAQRDLLDLTLIAAAGRAGETSLERALLAERAEAMPLVKASRSLAA